MWIYIARTVYKYMQKKSQFSFCPELWILNQGDKICPTNCAILSTHLLLLLLVFFLCKEVSRTVFFFSFHSRRGEFTHEKSLEASLRTSLVILWPSLLCPAKLLQSPIILKLQKLSTWSTIQYNSVSSYPMDFLRGLSHILSKQYPPGAIAFTLMPYCARSLAIGSVIPLIAPLVAEYATFPACPS